MARTRSQTRAQSKKRSQSQAGSRRKSRSASRSISSSSSERSSTSSRSNSRASSISSRRGRKPTKKVIHGRVSRSKNYEKATASSRSRTRALQKKKSNPRSKSVQKRSSKKNDKQRSRSVDYMSDRESDKSFDHHLLQDLPFSPIEHARSNYSSSTEGLDDSTFVLHNSTDTPNKAQRMKRATSTPKNLSEHMNRPATLLREVLMKKINKSRNEYDAAVYGIDSETDTETDVEIDKRSSGKTSAKKPVARQLFNHSNAADSIEIPCVLTTPLEVRTGQVVCIDPIGGRIFLQTIITIVSAGLKPEDIECEIAFARKVRPQMTVGNTCTENGKPSSNTIQHVFVGRRVIVIEKNTMFSEKNISDPVTFNQSRLYSKITKGMLTDKRCDRPNNQYLSMQSTDEASMEKDLFRKREFITLDFSKDIPESICEQRNKSIPIVLKPDTTQSMSQFHENIFVEDNKIFIDREVLIDTRPTDAGHVWNATIMTRKEERREYSYIIKENNGSLAYIAEVFTNEPSIWEYTYFEILSKSQKHRQDLSKIIQADLDRSRTVHESPSFPGIKMEAADITFPVEVSTPLIEKQEQCATSDTSFSSAEKAFSKTNSFDNSAKREMVAKKLLDISCSAKGKLSTTFPVSHLTPKSESKSKTFNEPKVLMEELIKQVVDDSYNGSPGTLKQHKKTLILDALINNKPYMLVSNYIFLSAADKIQIQPLKLVIDGKNLFDIKDKHQSEKQNVEDNVQKEKLQPHAIANRK